MQAPVGYFGPLGLSKDGDADTFYRRRCSEIKHGRVAMIAAMGYIVPEYFRFPGYCSTSQGIKFADIPNGLAALGKAPIEGWMQWIAFTGMLELYGARQDPSNPPGKLQGADEAYGPMTFGNLGAPSLWGASSLTDPEKKKRGLNSELANGRLAMMAITGMMFQNGYLGSTGPEMWFPSSAFEKELGVQAHTNSHSLNHQSSPHNETPTKSCVFRPDEKDRDMDTYERSHPPPYRRRWATSTPWASPRTAMRRSLRGSVPPRSSTAAWR